MTAGRRRRRRGRSPFESRKALTNEVFKANSSLGYYSHCFYIFVFQKSRQSLGGHLQKD